MMVNTVAVGHVPAASSSSFRVGQFDLLHPVGYGGMAEVWRARHLSGCYAAVKVITAEYASSTQYQRFFSREINAIAALDHPGIAAIYDVGQIDEAAAAQSAGQLVAGSPWMAMEYADQGDMRSGHSPTNWAELRDFLADTLDALAHAHARGVLHLDLKSENILVTGPELRKVIADFGISYMLFDEKQRDYGVCGTPSFMSPEQVRGASDDFGPWSDLYSLGCVAYELAQGTPPFDGDDADAIAQQHLVGPRPHLMPSFPVPPAFIAWLDKLMARKIGDRFTTAADALWALSKIRETRKSRPRESWMPSLNRPTLTALLGTNTNSTPLPEAEEIAALPPVPLEWRRPPDQRATIGAGLRLFGLRSTPLVGHDFVRDRMWAALHRVTETRQRTCLVLRGPSGSGKTHIVQWLAWRAAEVGAANVVHVLHGSDELILKDRRLGDNPLISQAHGRKRSKKNQRRRSATHKYQFDRAALAAVGMPGDAAEDLPRSSLRALTRAERYQEACQRVRNAAAERPVIVWIDDAGEDPDALNFAMELLETGPDAPLLLIVAAENEGNAPELDALRQSRSAEEIVVKPLSQAEHTRVIRAMLDLEPNVLRRLSQHTLGQPHFARCLIGEWIQRDFVHPTAEGNYTVRSAPGEAFLPNKQAVYRCQLRRAAESARNLDHAQAALLVAATLGPVVADAEWERACRSFGAGIDDQLVPRMAQMGLVQARAKQWSFRDRTARQVVLDEWRETPSWSAVNEACADILADDDIHAARRARMLLETTRVGEALRWLRVSIDDLLTAGSNRRALRSIERYEHAASAAFGSTSVELMQATPARIRALKRLGRLVEAKISTERLRSWAEQAEDVPLDLRCELARCQAELAMENDRFAGLEHFNHAVGLARSLTDPVGLAHALLGKARVLSTMGHLFEAAKWYSEAHRLGESRIDKEVVAAALVGMADTRVALMHEGAEELAATAERLYMNLGSPVGRASALLTKSTALSLARRWDEARECAEVAERLWQELDSSMSLVARASRGFILLELAQVDEAAAIFSRLGGPDAMALPREHRAMVRLGCAAVAVEQDDLAAWRVASKEYEQAIRHPYHRHPFHLQFTVRIAETWNARMKSEAASQAWHVASLPWRRIDRLRSEVYATLSRGGRSAPRGE